MTLSDLTFWHLNSLCVKWEIMVACVCRAGEWMNIHRAPKCIACTQQGARLHTGSLPWKAQIGFFGL